MIGQTLVLGIFSTYSILLFLRKKSMQSCSDYTYTLVLRNVVWVKDIGTRKNLEIYRDFVNDMIESIGMKV